MRVAIHLPAGPSETQSDRDAVAAWLRRALPTRLPTADVSADDSGVLIAAHFDPGHHGLGSIDAAAGVLDLAVQALELALARNGRGAQARAAIQQHLNAIQSADITVRPGTGATATTPRPPTPGKEHP